MKESSEIVTQPKKPRNSYRRSKSPEQRFWEKVDKSGPIPAHLPHLGNCWVWIAGLNKDGYGKFRYGKDIYAHRYSWLIHFGKSMEGLGVLHKCDNPSCIRPEHLWIGTPLDNTRDCISKGRNHIPIIFAQQCLRGEQITNSKLRECLIIEIRARAKTGETQKSIAAFYAVSETTISRVISKQLWKHVN